MAVVCKEFHFEAAHRLPNHDGDCSRAHGHSYRVQVYARGRVKPANGESDEGMVMDFGRLSAIWKEHLNPWLDHGFEGDQDEGLNAIVALPTAENVALFILDEFRKRAPLVERVVVWETATGFAEVTLADLE